MRQALGETISVLPVLAILAQGPGSILLTTGTVTSQRLLAQRLPEMGLESRVIHRFVPLDVPGWVARFLDHWKPDAAGFVESEIWPNLLSAAAAPRAFRSCWSMPGCLQRSLSRWKMAARTAREILGFFSIIHPQSAGDGERFASLARTPVLPAGNLKLAAPPLPVDGASPVSSLQPDRRSGLGRREPASRRG